jgi:pimeloyl-ACP methyl ester carboxylesterase
VLLGDCDELASVEEAMEMVRLLPRSELAVVPGADHRVLLYQGGHVSIAMLDFLLRHSASPEPAVST